MIAIGCDRIGISFGADTILEDVSFQINAGDKLGIVGVNGAGKSTLLRAICGKYQPDSGKVYIAGGSSIGFLEQNPVYESEQTVLERALDTFSSLVSAERELKALHERLEAEPSEELALKYAAAEERFAADGGYEFRGRCIGMLRHIGFGDDMLERRVSALSGGEKTRLALACLLLSDPDILLLDEPTNHLDTDMLFWLEEELRASRKTIVTVSHDRYFLDRLTTHILEIENTHGKLYRGNYSAYVKKKDEDRKIQQRHYDNQQKEIARIEAYIAQQRRWNRERNIIAAESRQKQLDKMEREERPERLPDAIKLRFTVENESGNDVISADRLAKSYKDRALFSDVSFEVRRGERVFISGPNGCGKSTLIKILAGRLEPDRGSICTGSRVEIGYYDQENRELDESKPVLDELWDSDSGMTSPERRSALALFNFRADDVEKRISVLSGGERARLALAKLVLAKPNLLILDEPTNHLDISSREVLESALEDYEGTLVAVSHDRYFVNKLASRMLDFGEGGIFDYSGTYASYLEYKGKHSSGSAPTKEAEAAVETTVSKDEYEELKRRRAEQQKKKRELERAHKRVGELEAEVARIDADIAAADVSDYKTIAELCDKKQACEDELLELYELTMSEE